MVYVSTTLTLDNLFYIPLPLAIYSYAYNNSEIPRRVFCSCFKAAPSWLFPPMRSIKPASGVWLCPILAQHIYHCMRYTHIQSVCLQLGCCLIHIYAFFHNGWMGALPPPTIIRIMIPLQSSAHLPFIGYSSPVILLSSLAQIFYFGFPNVSFLCLTLFYLDFS